MGSRVISWLQPREPLAAAKAASALAMVAAAITVVFAASDPLHSDPLTVSITVGIGLLVLGLAWGIRRIRVIPAPVWAMAPIIAITVITVADFVTGDHSVSAQVFFLFPVLYAAKQLPRRGAAIVTGCALAGEILVVTLQAPVRDAIVSIAYVGAAMITVAALLVTAAERQEALVQQLQRAAAIDPLTGLATRTVLDQAAQTALSVAASDHGTALVLIDVDAFKSINDEHGHPAGDEVLRQLAGLLTEAAGPNDVISRLGGDEIAMLIPGCSPQEMTDRATTLLRLIAGHPFGVGRAEPIKVTVSIGGAHAPTQAHDLRSMYSVADEALYRAKRGGRNQIALSTTERRPLAG